MAYKKIESIYEAIEYTGDIDALIQFGVSKVDLQNFKSVHCAISCKRGNILCAIGDYIIKDQFGNLDVVPKKEFEESYIKS